MLNAIFAELRHAAAAVRAAGEATSLAAFESAHAEASARWADARARAGAHLREAHQTQLEHLQARAACEFARRRSAAPRSLCARSDSPGRLLARARTPRQARLADAEADAVSADPVVVALRREQRTLLGQRQFTKAYDALKRLKDAEAKARAAAQGGRRAAAAAARAHRRL